MIQQAIILIFGLILFPNLVEASTGSKTINEGIAASNNTIFVATPTARVGFGTTAPFCSAHVIGAVLINGTTVFTQIGSRTGTLLLMASPNSSSSDVEFDMLNNSNAALYLDLEDAVAFMNNTVDGGVAMSGAFSSRWVSSTTATNNIGEFLMEAKEFGNTHIAITSLNGNDSFEFFPTSVNQGRVLPSTGTVNLNGSLQMISTGASSGWINSPSSVTASSGWFNGLSINGPPNSQALCLLGNLVGHCTTAVGAGGGCTCVSP